MGNAIKQSVVSKMIQKSVAEASESAVATTEREPVHQERMRAQISDSERDELFRTRERRSRKIQALIPPSLFEALSSRAQAQGVSVTEILIRALRDFLYKD